MSAPVMTAPQGVRLSSGRMTVVTAALLSGAAFVPTLCRLGDTMGWKKSLVIAGLGCLSAGALISALSSSLPLLLAGRAFTGAGMVCSSFGLIYVEDIPPEHVGRMFGISPILATGVGGSIAGAVFGAFLTSNTLPPAPGAPPGPPLPSIGAFEGFRGLAAGLTLPAAVFAAVYLVTYWSGFRGGDRAMVARPHFEEAVPAAVSGIGIPGTATGAEAS